MPEILEDVFKKEFEAWVVKIYGHEIESRINDLDGNGNYNDPFIKSMRRQFIPLSTLARMRKRKQDKR